jgi:hypothetical protein
VLLSSYFSYVSPQGADFTLSPADDLMDLLAGGFSPNFSTCLVMPAPLANERMKAYV